MFIDINRIGPEGISFRQEIRADTLEAEGEDSVTVVGGVVEGEAARGERGVGLIASLDAVVELSCSRCTERFRADLRTRFELTLVPDAVEFGSGETRVDSDDTSMFYAKEGRADLGEVAAEQIYLNLPLKPVCREGCKGLCPRCGANRNLGDCGCTAEPTDPRLAPLLQFKKRPGDGG